MKNSNENTATMTTIEKIQAVLTPMQIRKIKVDFEFIKDEYEAQNINSVKFQQLTEMISANARKNLNTIQEQTWRLFGGGGMVIMHEAIVALCGKFELNMYKKNKAMKYTVEKELKMGGVIVENYIRKFNWLKFKFEQIRVDVDKVIVRTIKDEYIAFCDDGSVILKDFNGNIIEL